MIRLEQCYARNNDKRTHMYKYKSSGNTYSVVKQTSKNQILMKTQCETVVLSGKLCS